VTAAGLARSARSRAAQLARTARSRAAHLARTGALLALALAAGCSSVPLEPPGAPAPVRPRGDPTAPPSAATPVPGQTPQAGARPSRGGAYYQDDGPGNRPPAALHAIPDAVPRAEPLHPAANRPYTVFGQRYVPRPELTSHRERGMASWYGRKFHGRPTSSGERYDMYGMTAAHPTLPIPSYVRVTSIRTGRTVVVRVNDRGPFLNRRVIDLSYTAAHRLGYVDAGSTEVEVELLQPPVAAARGPVQTAVRADVAVAPGPAEPAPPPTPMLAEAQPALTIETLIDDRPVLSGEIADAPLLVAVATMTPVAAASPSGPATGEPEPVWLQFGAFASRGGADAVKARVAREQSWLAVPVDVVRHGDLWRVRAGPWADREDARTAAERIVAAGSQRPIVVTR